MKILSCENLTSRTLRSDVLPWEFQQTETITAQVRHDKTERQNWYHNPATKHNFYSLVEPWNPNQRCSQKDNPPRFLHGFMADYDVEMAPEYVEKAISEWPIKPTYLERSLGGKWHLIWLLEEPMLVGDYDFAVFVLERAVKWLKLHVLPDLDTPAFLAPERMLCNSCEGWRKVGGTIPRPAAKVFFMEAGRAYTFKPADEVNIPIGEIEQALKDKFPRFASWEGGFDYEAQGPTFWVDGSESPKSAIVKTQGMFTFSAHAAKPFYSWKELLGADFVSAHIAEKMEAATRGIYYDGIKYWRENPATRKMEPEDLNAIRDHLQTDLGLSTKQEKDGSSQLSRALQYIRNYCRVKCATSVLFREPGVIRLESNPHDPVLNINIESHVLQPSGEPAVWGPDGKFPFISSVLLDNMFEPHAQLQHFLSWLAHFYRAALERKGRSGQAIFLIGGPGMGKTLLVTLVISGLTGGYADGSKFVCGQDQFGAELFENPVIFVDDEVLSSSDNQKVRMEAVVKQLVANAFQRTRQLYQKAGVTEWFGRLIFAANMDLISTRIMPTLADGMREKVNFYRVAEKATRPKLVYPDNDTVKAIVKRELPHFAQFLSEFQIPKEFMGESRFHIKAYHDEILKERSAQSSRASQFSELLYEVLADYFRQNPEAEVYETTSTALSREIMKNPLNQEVLRTLRSEQVTRFLEQLVRDGTFKCETDTVNHNIRKWKFKRVETDSRLPIETHATTFRK